MNREWQLSGFSSSLDHASNAHPAERLAALIEEDVIGLEAPFRIGPPQLAERFMFVPLQARPVNLISCIRPGIWIKLLPTLVAPSRSAISNVYGGTIKNSLHTAPDPCLERVHS